MLACSKCRRLPWSCPALRMKRAHLTKVRIRSQSLRQLLLAVGSNLSPAASGFMVGSIASCALGSPTNSFSTTSCTMSTTTPSTSAMLSQSLGKCLMNCPILSSSCHSAQIKAFCRMIPGSCRFPSCINHAKLCFRDSYVTTTFNSTNCLKIPVEDDTHIWISLCRAAVKCIDDTTFGMFYSALIMFHGHPAQNLSSSRSGNP